MYAVRLWSVRHARGLASFYKGFEGVLVRLHPLLERIGYKRLERPVAAVERGVKGLLFDCRMCGQLRAEFHRHVLPDELPEAAAQRAVRRRPRQRQLRGQARDALRLGRGLARRRAHARAGWMRSSSCNRRSTGARGQLGLAAGRAREERSGPVKFEDEPVPGYPLPILPGHTSPGRLERVLRAGAFAVTAELDPPDSADPEDVYERARVFDG